VNDYCYRMVKSRNTACLFDITSIYDGTTDNLRDKLVADAKEPLIWKLAKTGGEYVQVKLYNAIYTGITMKSLKNGSTIYTVNGYAKKDGSGNFVEIKTNEGIDWS